MRGQTLGKGSFGLVLRGVYDCRAVAAKVALSAGDAEAARDMEREAAALLRLDHPNCLFMYGYALAPEAGGPLLLTEHCAEGSLFDVYGRRQAGRARARRYFSRVPCLWRIRPALAGAVSAPCSAENSVPTPFRRPEFRPPRIS